MNEREQLSDGVRGTWFRPDFSDPCFRIVRVDDAPRCRHESCKKLAAHLVEYTQRRGVWTYEYGCGYCDQHLPTQVRNFGDSGVVVASGER